MTATWTAPTTTEIAYATALGETTLDGTIATVRADRDRRRELGYDTEDQDYRLTSLLQQRLASWATKTVRADEATPRQVVRVHVADGQYGTQMITKVTEQDGKIRVSYGSRYAVYAPYHQLQVLG